MSQKALSSIADRKMEKSVGASTQPCLTPFVTLNNSETSPPTLTFVIIPDDTSKTTVLLGVWDKEAHLDWLEKHPSKRSKYVNKDNEIVHQYYGGGDICDVTGRRRFVEVRLKCKDNPNNVQYISEYLIETKTCEYILVVESPMFCDAQDADLDGFIDVT
ncbi:hypothetical protein LSH36_126g08053 [Paralvinella palmiformis]|uniref:Endoplasmic reticulum lectin 1 n=1 Tax=Paralvinella palmiformis TaxID=53620 RepID=A0AAD9JYK5_9ANNE|nr:hypothetical protein LSH36_126g08053 [Paralvinella palmiformis]